MPTSACWVQESVSLAAAEQAGRWEGEASDQAQVAMASADVFGVAFEEFPQASCCSAAVHACRSFVLPDGSEAGCTDHQRSILAAALPTASNNTLSWPLLGFCPTADPS